MDETDSEDRDMIPAKRSNNGSSGADRNYSLAVCLKFGAVYIMKNYDDVCPIGMWGFVTDGVWRRERGLNFQWWEFTKIEIRWRCWGIELYSGGVGVKGDL